MTQMMIFCVVTVTVTVTVENAALRLYDSQNDVKNTPNSVFSF